MPVKLFLCKGFSLFTLIRVVFAETRITVLRLRSRVSEQIDAVKETIVTVAVELNLAYGSIRVLKVKPKNRLLRLFGVKLKRARVSGV